MPKEQEISLIIETAIQCPLREETGTSTKGGRAATPVIAAIKGEIIPLKAMIGVGGGRVAAGAERGRVTAGA